MALLPEYCRDAHSFTKDWVPDNPTPRQRNWVALMGKTFWAIHHYCWAQLNARRAGLAGVSKQDRDHLLRTAIADSIYVLNDAPQGFILTPEIYTRMGDFHQELGAMGEAFLSYDNAIRTKASYWPAYARLARMYARLGKRKDALHVLQQGLRAAPDSVGLTELFKELGGDPRLVNLTPSAPASGAM